MDDDDVDELPLPVTPPEIPLKPSELRHASGHHKILEIVTVASLMT